MSFMKIMQPYFNLKKSTANTAFNKAIVSFFHRYFQSVFSGRTPVGPVTGNTEWLNKVYVSVYFIKISHRKYP